MIELEHVTKRYGAHAAVDEVSLHVGRGELLAVVGASGSGKTTLLKMVNRLIEPSSGRVLIDGADTATIDPPVLRRRIGYVFQQVGLFPHLTVAENVALPLTLAGWRGERVRRRVDELLVMVELDPAMRDRAPAELSGGQQQRVGVARALAASPHLMLLDEPFGALDPLTRDRLQQSFLRLHRELGLTTMFVTHDMAEALLLADRIAVMQRGRAIQVAAPHELLREPATGEVRTLIETPVRQARRVGALMEPPPA